MRYVTQYIGRFLTNNYEKENFGLNDFIQNRDIQPNVV